MYKQFEGFLNDQEASLIEEFDKYHIHLDIIGFINHINKIKNDSDYFRTNVEELLRYWVTKHPEDFRERCRKNTAINLINQLQLQNMNDIKSALNTIPIFTDNQEQSQISLSFDQVFSYDVATVASNMVHFDGDLFGAIKPTDFVNKLWKKDQNSPITTYLRKIDNISNWTASTILSKEESSSQAAVLVLFCQLLAVFILGFDANLLRIYVI